MGEDADRPRMQDEPTEPPVRQAQATGDGAPPSAPPRPPVDRAFARLRGSLGGRSLSVYGVLLAGAAVLMILLAIVWITAGDNDDEDGPTCLNIYLESALDRIKANEVERIRVSYSADSPVLGPAALSLNTTDGACHNLQPQGAGGQLEIYAVLGAVDFHNRTSDERQIRVSEDGRDNLSDALFWTPTPSPTATVPPAPTEPIPTDGPASPTAAMPTETPFPSQTPTVEAGTPEASPDASPVDGSPAVPDLPVTVTETVPETPPAG